MGLKPWVLGRCPNRCKLPMALSKTPPPCLLTQVQSLSSLALMPLKYLQNALSHTLLGVEIRPASSARLGFADKSLCPSPSVLHSVTFLSRLYVVLSQSSMLPEDSRENLFSHWPLRNPDCKPSHGGQMYLSVLQQTWLSPGQPSKLTKAPLSLSYL